MKYLPYTIWLLITGVLCVTMFPAIVAYSFTNWFEIGSEILES